MEMKDCPEDGCEVQVSSIVAHTGILGFYLALLAFNCTLLHKHMSLCVWVCGSFSQLSVQFLRTKFIAFTFYLSAMHCASFDFADSMPLCETGSHCGVTRASF